MTEYLNEINEIDLEMEGRVEGRGVGCGNSWHPPAQRSIPLPNVLPLLLCLCLPLLLFLEHF